MEAPGNNVHFLHEWKPYIFDILEHKIVFYPCGCHQKHSDANVISWVKNEIKSTEHIHIGIAHGNVEGYGLDDEVNYFSMTTAELRDAGVDCWLLGHIHAPYPKTDHAGQEIFFFSGNHCSESWKAERNGGAWLISIDQHKKINAERWHHQGICFRDRMFGINNILEAQEALAEINKLSPKQTVLRVTLNGSLTEEELGELKIKFSETINEFLYAETIWNIGMKITRESIDKLFVTNSIPHRLLTALSTKKDDELAMQLAYETIKSLSK
jgi:hypothetical protein